MEAGELGQRIAYWRQRRGMTQQLFADRIGKSVSWVAKVETGHRNASQLEVINRICEVLRVDMPVLLGRGLARENQQCLNNTEAEAIRAALERYDVIATSLRGEVEPVALEQLQRQVRYVWTAFEVGDYSVIGATLPQLITDAQRAHAASDSGDPHLAAAQLLAEVYQLAASTLRKLGEYELAWLAGDRGIPVAEETGNVLVSACTGFRVANALLATGRARAAYDLNISYADRVETGVMSPAALPVYGNMLLQAAMAAATHGDARSVRDLFKEAATVAERVGPGRDDYGLAFGQVNVGVHRVAAYVALGEGGTAIEVADQIDPAGLTQLRRERHANHLVDLARGHSQAGHRGAALEQLLAAEQRAAAEVQCRPAARAAIGDLLRRAHPSPPLELSRLADRAGVAA